MKLLLFIALLIFSFAKPPSQSSFLLIFTSEGTYYKLQLQSKHIEWYSTLGSSLLSFQLNSQMQNQSEQHSYILPTLDGHFLYIDAESQILINRHQVQHILNICFDNRLTVTDQQPASQYFIYEKFEYYIINLKNGKATDIQELLKKGIPHKLNQMAVLKVSKKYLKQMKADLSVAWSTLSSQIDLVAAQTFLKNTKASAIDNKQFLNSTKLKFRRLDGGEIELLGQKETFELGGSGHIIGLFQFIDSDKGYIKHPIEYQQRPRLALQYISQSGSSKQLRQFSRQNAEISSKFIHSEQIKPQKRKQNDMQFCIDAFRNLKALTDQSKGIFVRSIGVADSHGKPLENQSLAFPKIQFTEKPNYIIQYGPTKQQPYIWITLLITVLIFAFWFHKSELKSLTSKYEAMESQNDKKFQQFRKKFDKIESYQKMYEVNWDKIIYQYTGQQWYEHIIFEGKFLNQDTYVYAVRQQRADIISLEYKLNILINCSHKNLTKLYYYTKNTQYLLIFVEKVQILSPKKFQALFNQEISNKKEVIRDILEAISYIDNKIEISWLPYESISLQQTPQSQAETRLQFKLNSLPCFLKRPLEDSEDEELWSLERSTYELRIDMVSIFHLILLKGQRFNKQYIDELLKNQAYSQEEYLQFFDFVLYEVKQKIDDIQKDSQESLRANMYSQILDHPFLWDSKRKILFLTDFSNYIQTHIDEAKVRKLQGHAKDYKIITIPWIKEFHFLFAKQISGYRKYDFESVRDLIRVIRNKLNHFHEIPKEVRNHIGVTPEGFIEYCLGLFPKLLHFAFIYTHKKKWKLHMK